MWSRQGWAAVASIAAHGALAALMASGERRAGARPGGIAPETALEWTAVEIWSEAEEGGAAIAPGGQRGPAPAAGSEPARAIRRRGAGAGTAREPAAAARPVGPAREGVPLLDPARAAALAEPDRGPPAPPGPLAMRAPTLRISPRPPRSELEPAGGGRFRADQGPFVAHVERDGRVRFEDRPSIDARLHTEWRFELTDLAMRAAGMDPYVSRKMDFLDRTRDERMALAANERSGNLRDSLARTPAHLERIWRGPGDLASRRRLLFTLWDECAESGPDEVVATARAVRASIVAFIRRRLPRGSRAGYRDAEIEALNARRTSRERFAPYAP